MKKEKAIAIIKSRIITEHGKYAKYPEMDWAEIAARKVYAEMKELIFISAPDVIKPVCEKCGEPLLEDMNTKELFCPILTCK